MSISSRGATKGSADPRKFHLNAGEHSVTDGLFNVRQAWGPLSELAGATRVKVVVTDRRLIFLPTRGRARKRGVCTIALSELRGLATEVAGDRGVRIELADAGLVAVQVRIGPGGLLGQPSSSAEGVELLPGQHSHDVASGMTVVPQGTPHPGVRGQSPPMPSLSC